MNAKGFVEDKGKEPVADRHVRRQLSFDAVSDGEISTSAGSASSGKICVHALSDQPNMCNELFRN